MHDAGHHLGQRRLAGAVLADQRMNLAAPEIEIDVLDRGHAGIELGRVAKREDGIAHARNLLLDHASAATRKQSARPLGEHVEQCPVASRPPPRRHG